MFEMAEAAGTHRPGPPRVAPGEGSGEAATASRPPLHLPLPTCCHAPGSEQGGADGGAASLNQPFKAAKAAAAPALIHYLRLRGGRERPPPDSPPGLWGRAAEGRAGGAGRSPMPGQRGRCLLEPPRRLDTGCR